MHKEFCHILNQIILVDTTVRHGEIVPNKLDQDILL